MGKLILVLGGARSGKSTYAETRARELGGDAVLYVATAEAKDEEMRERARKHQAQRPASWRTLEAPRHVGERIRATLRDERVVLLDCVAVLSANVLIELTGPYDQDAFAEPKDPFNPAIEQAIQAEVTALIAAVDAFEGTLIIVSNEVGLGVVPPYELGRIYRDLLGRANQTLARRADEVYLLVAGIPMTVKGG